MFHNNNSSEIVFSCSGRTYALCRKGAYANKHFTDAMGAGIRRRLASPSNHDVARLLQSVRSQDLRRLLSDDPQSWSSLDDQQLRSRMAALLQSGGVVLFECMGGFTLAPRPVMKVPVQKKDEDEIDYAFIHHARSPSDIGFSRQAPRKLPPKSDGETIDQDAQIAALTAAAESGLAFCEMCTKKDGA